MKTSERLSKAAYYLGIIYNGHVVTSVLFEDGSGNKFLFGLNGENPTRYTTWEKMCIELGFNPDRLLTHYPILMLWCNVATENVHCDALSYYKAKCSPNPDLEIEVYHLSKAFGKIDLIVPFSSLSIIH